MQRWHGDGQKMGALYMVNHGMWCTKVHLTMGIQLLPSCRVFNPHNRNPVAKPHVISAIRRLQVLSFVICVVDKG